MSLKGVSCRELTHSVHEAEMLNLQQMEAFPGASEAMRFQGESRQSIYPWMERVPSFNWKDLYPANTREPLIESCD
jgi:hypothetical protein